MKNKKEFILLYVVGLIMVVTSSAMAGSISGKVVYDGEAPKFRQIKMDADPICLTKHGKPVYPQSLLLGANKELGNVFVYVKKGLPNKKYTPPTEPVVLDQKGCMYTPHVTGVMVGQPVKILNPDGTLHNVHAMSKINPEFNLAMPKFRKSTTKVFDKPEFMFAMRCDVHPWMVAWLSVMSHPYFSVTSTDGIFKIDNLPAGTYTIEAWQEKLGVKTAEVTISGSEEKTIDFTFSRPSKK